MVFGLLLGWGKVDRTWRIEIPKEPPFTVRLPAEWTPRKPMRPGAPTPSPRPGVSTTFDFVSPTGRSLTFLYIPNARPKDRRILMNSAPAKVGKRLNVVRRSFKRGRWSVVAGGVRSSTVSFMRPEMSVSMSDGKTLRYVMITAPEGGAQPSETLALRICESLLPVRR